MKVTLTVGTCIVDNDGTRAAKAGDVVDVSERDAAHLVAIGKAEAVTEAKAAHSDGAPRR